VGARCGGGWFCSGSVTNGAFVIFLVEHEIRDGLGFGDDVKVVVVGWGAVLHVGMVGSMAICMVGWWVGAERCCKFLGRRVSFTFSRSD
jgi:hypothetical protein